MSVKDHIILVKVEVSAELLYWIPRVSTLLHLQYQRRPGRRRWYSAVHTHDPVDKGLELTPYNTSQHTACVCVCFPTLNSMTSTKVK